MSNYKIRVNSEAESKEVQELFVVLGAACCSGLKRNKNANFLFMNSGFVTACKLQENFDKSKCKEITLPDLRDLVVLNRNDAGDANVLEENCLYDLYLTESKELYFYHCSKNKWILSNLNGDDDYYELLKPIGKKEMKEYLRKNSNGTYSYIGPVHTDHVHDLMIEIPEGANFAWKSDGKYVFFTALEMGYRDASVIWSRHTHPEELPFIDDESYNPNYDGAEQEELESLNDQYAGIEKVRQTLNQRQSQYGSFEDVAMITEQMVDVMRKGYYENLAYNQKMALYMICSKMARIVNGNPNHKDSWHDIAGYATLIDNELVSEKDMPF